MITDLFINLYHTITDNPILLLIPIPFLCLFIPIHFKLQRAEARSLAKSLEYHNRLKNRLKSPKINTKK